MQFSTLNTLIESYWQKRIALFLLGEAGIGKTEFLKEKAHSLETEIFIVHCNLLDEKSDLTGARTVLDPKTQDYVQRFFPMETINSCILYASEHPDKPVVLFFDELNRTNTDVMSGCQTLITDRCIGCRQLPENVVIVAAGNDIGNVNVLDSASVSRYSVFKMNPDLPTFFKYNPDLHPSIRKVLSGNPELLVCYSKSQDEMLDEDVVCQFTTPRTISCLSHILNTLSSDELRALSLEKDQATGICGLQELIEGAVGKTLFANALERQLRIDMKKSRTSRVKSSCSLNMNVDPVYEEFVQQKKVSDLDAFLEKADLSERMEIVKGLLLKGAPAPVETYCRKAVASVMNHQNDKHRCAQISQIVLSKAADKDVVECILQQTSPLAAFIRSLTESTVY